MRGSSSAMRMRKGEVMAGNRGGRAEVGWGLLRWGWGAEPEGALGPECASRRAQLPMMRGSLGACLERVFSLGDARSSQGSHRAASLVFVSQLSVARPQGRGALKAGSL